MKAITRQNLLDALSWCNENDKSTPFTIQYMMDYAKVQHETVMLFLENESKKEVAKCVCGWLGTMHGLDVDDITGEACCPKCQRDYTRMASTEETEKGV
jgi:hypothetical protein